MRGQSTHSLHLQSMIANSTEQHDGFAHLSVLRDHYQGGISPGPAFLSGTYVQGGKHAPCLQQAYWCCGAADGVRQTS